MLTFGALGAVPLIGWLLLTQPDHAGGATVTRAPLPWRSRVAWLLVAAFSLQGIIFYGVITWLAPALVERGYTALEAGTVVGVMLIFGIPGTLLVSWLGDRLPSRRIAMVVTSIETLIAVAGFALLPQFALVWSVLGGLGLAGIFALVMTLPLDAASRPTDVAAYSGVMLSVGYLVSAVAPALLGAARDATGNFMLTMLLMVVTAVVMLAVSLVVSPSRLRPATGA